MINLEDISSLGSTICYVEPKSDVVFQWDAFHLGKCDKEEKQQFVTILNIVNKYNKVTKVINDIKKHMNINGYHGVCSIYKA